MITIVENLDGTRSIHIGERGVRLLSPEIQQLHTGVASAHAERMAPRDSRFVKLDAAGNPLPADASAFAAVQDNQTGLQWSATLSEGLVDYAGAEKACQALDLAGHGDWRLPTRPELESLLDLTRHKPAIDTGFFPDTRTDDWYWTSTPCAWRSGASWCVVFNGGGVGYGGHDSRCFVRAVRSVVPAPGQ